MNLSPGTTLLDKYRIERLLGAGAFGQVYLVQHLRLHAERAVKVLPRNFPGVSPEDFAMFERRFWFEAQLGAALAKSGSQRVLQVHDFQVTSEALLLEMEYAPGGSLKDLLPQPGQTGQPLPVNQALQYALQTAEGLAPLHSMDIVHRDVKPSNLLLDERGNVKLADLGLAQSRGGPSLRSKLSNPQPHPGTPAYMSPEQVNSRDYLTSASDIYSLGVVLFELLTLRNPKNLRPGTRLREVRKDAPAWLDELLACMLAVDPQQRPWDGAEAAEKLKEAGERQQHAVEQARQNQEDELTRKREEARQLAIAMEKQDFDAALRQKNWEQAKVHLNQLELLQAGEIAAHLREQLRLAQAEAETEKRSQVAEAARLASIAANESEFEVALKTARWETARACLQKLRELKAGNTADRLSQKLQKAIDEQQAEERRQREAAALQDNPALIEWVSIPAGEFLYGAKKEKKRIQQAYRIGKYPVTQAQYQKFINASPNYPVPGDWDAKKRTFPAGKADHPVANISWKDAQAFCKWANCRLPTEEEWEKAARGEDGRKYPWGNEGPDATRANFNQNEPGTTPVGKYSPRGDSPYGCVDMSGNVWEWTASKLDSNQYILRGGSRIDVANLLKVAFRFNPDPSYKSYDVGFRCARDP